MSSLRFLTKRFVYVVILFSILNGSKFNTFAQTTNQQSQTGISKTNNQANLKRDDFHRRDNHKKDDYRRDERNKPIVINPMSDEHFNLYLSKISKVAFNDCKFAIIEVCCINNFFTCRQVLSIIKLFNFDDEKIDVLKIMSPNILDKENGEILAEHFTFDRYKNQAKAILK